MSSRHKTAFVIAHFHVNGRVPLNTHALVAEMAKYTDSIVFVSTNLQENESNLLKKYAIVIQRENIGYDFWSYKLGIDKLGDLSRFDRIVICNTSFICLNPKFLVQNFTSEILEVGVRSISKSYENSEHLQSYWLSFEGNLLLTSPEFRSWWSQLVPLDQRQKNIDLYEIGLSTYFLKLGYSLNALFKIESEHLLMIFCRAVVCGIFNISCINSNELFTIDSSIARNLNPTIYAWDYLLDATGVVKLEQLKFNYAKLDTVSKLSTLDEPSILLIQDALK
jgi:lipopolysaccharide biosynthesis protein